MKKNLILIRKSLRINLRLGFSYLRSNLRLFLFSLVIGLVAIYSLPQILSSIRLNRTPTIGLVGNYTISTLPLSLQREISIGLTTLNNDNSATTGAAINWSTSPDKKTITFDLDKTLFWQDGTKFDTSQINYNLKSVEVKRLSLYSLEFKFDKPFAPLPTIVSQPLFKNGLIGLGENKVENIKLNGRFIGSIQLQNMQTGAKKIYKFFPTEQMAVQALKLGVVTQVQNIHDDFNLKTDPHYSVSTFVDPNIEAVLFINMRKDLLAEKTLRQSLSYSIPDIFDEGDSAISSLPQNSWAKTNSVKKYSQNMDLAKTDFEKISSKSAKIKITLSTSKELENTAKKIAESWAKIGLQTTINVVDSAPNNFDVYLSYLSLPLDPDQYALWHSTQLGNIAGYKSFKADRLLEDGRVTFEQSQRKIIYSDFQKALTEDIPAIFLYYPKLYTITKK